MFNFTAQPPAATTAAPTTFYPTFTFTPSTKSQPWNPFGTTTTTQPFTMGSSVSNTSTTRPFGNPPTSTASVNLMSTNFGANQPASGTQPTSVFGSNLTGTTVKFNPVLGQGPNQATTAASNIFANNNNTTKPTNPFGPTTFNPPAGLFSQTFPTAPATSTAPLTFPPNTAPITNIFGTSTSTITNPFNIITTTTPVTTSVFTSTTTTNPFAIKLVTTRPASVFPTNPNTPVPFIFGPQPAANTNIFTQPPTATSVAGIVPTPITNIFGVPITTTATAVPAVNSFITQATLPPFSSGTFATNIFGTNTLATTTASYFTPQSFTGLPVTQSQPAVTTSSSTATSQGSVSTIQQQFLAASLLDPYANRGKKDFTNIDQIQVPIESTVVSTSSTTINTTPIPVTLPIQSNARKVSSSRSLVDVNFKLKPASSLPTLNDDIKPSNQQSTTSIGQMKSTLAGNFTDEEELVLLGRTKMSKLRLSNDIINSSHQSDSIRSLYPLRRLADLEKLTNLTPPSSPTTTRKINNEQTSRSSSESRDVSPNHHSNPPTIPKQSSSPMIQRKSTNNSQADRLPILTRDNYYMKPTLSELKSLFNDKGQCIIKQFTVGHEKYGSVTFYGEINVAGLNLDEIIEIKRHEVIVYPDDDNKPSVGEELNIPARITLFGVYPIDRSTHEEITDIERIKAANYSEHLRTVTKKFDGEFINYGIQDGAWTFMVKHFTRYGLDDNIEFDKTVITESKLNV